ncbi:MAG TPA: M23 family metallopeptidase [Gammaproteobacteria bacterium]|nr:M23 family metallopeptidase [Gammaproteobacteria bacterium]
MGVLPLLFASLVAAQGQALQLRYADEAGLESVEVEWSGRSVPFVRRGAIWLTVLGVDLDTDTGEQTAEVRFHYSDGRSKAQPESIMVRGAQYPTTELTVESRYVELSPEDQARAAREDDEIMKIYSTLTLELYWSEPFQVPVPGITDGRNFGHRRVFNGQPRAPHSGADLRATTGTPIHAANRGRIVLAKDLFFSGNAVFIDHGLGVYSAYLHLSEMRVAVGTMVERGQVIGLAGATGRVTGPHLHWGVRVLDARVDPFSLLNLGGE